MLTTTLHHYSYDLRKPADAKAYEAMKAKIAANSDGRGTWMNCWGGSTRPESRNDSEIVTLETKHLFGNQWNETNRRLFDWYEEYITNGSYSHYKRGHWLEITPEMAQLRRDTLTCGYCGKHYGPLHDAPPANGFCAACLDSPYLKQGELHLLRLLPVLTTFNGKRAPLTTEESAELLPAYISRQTTGADSRAAKAREKQRADILSDYKKTTVAAETKRDGLLWFMDRGWSTDNIIYYSHTDRFCYGWRNPVSKEIADKLLAIISEFPFRYTIKTDYGATFENE